VNGAPLNDRSIGVPIIDAKVLMGTVNTNMAFVFVDIANGAMFAAVRPNGIYHLSAI